MKKTYVSPELSKILVKNEEIMSVSVEEALDITVSFDTLWNA